MLLNSQLNSPLNSSDVATIAFPYVKKCMIEYKGAFFLKALSRPFWFQLTRIGIEIAVVMTRPKIEPVLKYLIDLFKVVPDDMLAAAGIDKKFVVMFLELVQTPKEKMSQPIQQNLTFLERQEPLPYEY